MAKLVSRHVAGTRIGRVGRDRPPTDMRDMFHECPVCRGSQPWTTLFKPIWAKWRCRDCDSLLTIDTKRRMLVMFPLSVVFVVVALTVPRQTGSELMIMPVALAALLVFLFRLDRAAVLERAGFRCTRCGYDLRGQREPLCPECGKALDATERAQMSLSDPAVVVGRERRGGGIWVNGLMILLVVGLFAWGTVQFLLIQKQKALRAVAATSRPALTAPATTQRGP